MSEVAENRSMPAPKSAIKIGAEQLVFFNRQLASMARLNLPLSRGLKSLAKEVQDENFRAVIESVQKDLEQGVPLKDTLLKFPGSFPKLYIEILSAGEATGNLTTVLDQLAHYYETMDIVDNRLATATVYPKFVGVFTALLVSYILLLAVPEFEKMFAARGSLDTLPFLTRLVIAGSHFLKAWYISVPLVLLVVGGGWLGIRWFRNQSEIYDRFILRLPLFGTLFKSVILAKVCGTMGALLRNGVSMVESLNLTGRVSGNVAVKNVIEDMKRAVENGERMSAHCGKVDIFPETMVWKLQTAEDRGIIEEAFEELARQYEREVEFNSQRVASLLGPLMILFIAVTAGLVVISLYMPLFNLQGK